MLRGHRWLWLPPLLLVAGCATATHPRRAEPPPSPPPPSTPAPAPRAARPPLETGQASWYGQAHHGRLTASGEVFDMHDLTAAHRTLPMGTRALVTNTSTGDAAEVRINDRGPFKDSRVLDLSYGAARLLGAVGPGVIPVKIQVLELPEGVPSPSTPGGGRYAIQLGAFSTKARADALRQALVRDGVESTVSASGAGSEIYYRVRVGDFTDRRAAEEAARTFAAQGRRAVIVER